MKWLDVVQHWLEHASWNEVAQMLGIVCLIGAVIAALFLKP